MTNNLDFLIYFSDNLKLGIGNAPIGLCRTLNSLSYSTEFDYDKAKEKLRELNNVANKILSIIYNPRIKVIEREVVKRSEQSGKLSHESFDRTMKEPNLWKEKRGKMVPEYVHTVETDDSIDTYENRFIALLINEISLDVDKLLSHLNPLMESIEEHYQSKELNFGAYSLFMDLRKQSYPYNSFFTQKDASKNSVLVLANKLKKKIKNFKGTNFYKICSKHPISKSVMATNVLIHDNLYSYCYRFYVTSYLSKGKDEERRNILLYNYFTASLLDVMKQRKLFGKDEEVNLSFSEDGKMIIGRTFFIHYPFILELETDSTRLGLKLTIHIQNEKSEILDCSKYEFLFSENYIDITKDYLDSEKKKLEHQGVNQIIYVTINNILREYHDVITFSYFKKNHVEILENILSGMTLLFEVTEDLYHNYCPVCGHSHIQKNEENYCCKDCESVYKIVNIEGKSLLWIKSFRREL